MPEIKAILEHWRSEPAAKGVLATVVHVQGSAYRRPGARMLLLEDGRRIGSISGGCLEGDLSKKAWWWTSSGKPCVRVYDTSSDEDAVWEFGLGCNGVIDVLLERLDSPGTQRAIAFAEQARCTDGGLVSATVIRSQSGSQLETGDRFFLDSEARLNASKRHGSQDLILERMQDCRERQRSCLLHLNGADLFIEWIGPTQKLVVFGAGHDAIPVVKLAMMLGWNVTVADGRPGYVCPERFFGARTHLLKPGCDINALGIDESTAVVMMTHNLPQDQRWIGSLLAARPRYLGLLGPVRRTERLFSSIGLRYSDFPVHAPVGLDTGAETPESIAIAIIAEIQCVLNGREGGKLRLRKSRIHPDVEVYGQDSSLNSLPAGLLTCEVQNA